MEWAGLGLLLLVGIGIIFTGLPAAIVLIAAAISRALGSLSVQIACARRARLEMPCRTISLSTRTDRPSLSAEVAARAKSSEITRSDAISTIPQAWTMRAATFLASAGRCSNRASAVMIAKLLA